MANRYRIERVFGEGCMAIKPENIMPQDGHALVADFGIGKTLSYVEGESFTQVGSQEFRG